MDTDRNINRITESQDSNELYRKIFIGQARLLAARAAQDLPLTSGSLQRLAVVGAALDAARQDSAHREERAA